MPGAGARLGCAPILGSTKSPGKVTLLTATTSGMVEIMPVSA